jgi:hypothetical protein
MERINTKTFKNVLINGSTVESTTCDYELSNYGVMLGKSKELVTNDVVGFLIRVKPSSSNEGGIMAGVGSICSWLIDETFQ